MSFSPVCQQAWHGFTVHAMVYIFHGSTLCHDFGISCQRVMPWFWLLVPPTRAMGWSCCASIHVLSCHCFGWKTMPYHGFKMPVADIVETNKQHYCECRITQCWFLNTFDLKEYVKTLLPPVKYDVVDMGPREKTRVDYPEPFEFVVTPAMNTVGD